jgi:predicted Zn finger-like uncharacterized protein
MIVMCEGCETNFQVEDRYIKSSGSKVRCSKCRHVFTAFSPEALALANEFPVVGEAMPAAAPTADESELPDIGAQIDSLFTDNFGVAADDSVEQEPELLDVEDLLAEDSPSASALNSAAVDDDLKLDLDLDLNFDEEAAEQDPADDLPDRPVLADSAPVDVALDAQAERNGESDDTLASLDELGIKFDNLEANGEDLLPAEAALEGVAGDEPSGLDLDLELDLDALVTDTAEEPAPEPSAIQPEMVLPAEAADVLAESVLSEAPAAKAPAVEGELDLSDLEAMLDGDPQPSEPQRDATVLLDLELDAKGEAVDRSEPNGILEELDLAGITADPSVEVDAIDTAAAAPLETDLALDVDGSAAMASDAAVAEAPLDDELDFSDITNILEEPLTEPEKENAAAAPELDLFLGDGAPPATAEAPASQADAQEGLLLDIESLLEQDDTNEAAAETTPDPTTEELDLDITLGAAPAVSDDLEIEIESGADENENRRATGLVASAAAADDEHMAEPTPFSIEGSTGTAADGATDAIDMGVEAAASAAVAATAPRHAGLRRYLLAAAGAAALLGAVVLVPRTLDVQVPFLNDLDIPFLGRVFQPPVQDPAGNLKLVPVADKLNAQFVDHPGAGRLCVIRGQIRNDYDHPRSAIRVTAKLFNKDKALAKSATVFAGNVFANQELAGLDLAAINGRLNTREGANKTNLGVKPGQFVPFMAVFDGLPENLDEYSVEVAGSVK